MHFHLRSTVENLHIQIYRARCRWLRYTICSIIINIQNASLFPIYCWHDVHPIVWFNCLSSCVCVVCSWYMAWYLTRGKYTIMFSFCLCDDRRRQGIPDLASVCCIVYLGTGSAAHGHIPNAHCPMPRADGPSRSVRRPCPIFSSVEGLLVVPSMKMPKWRTLYMSS